MRFSSFPLVAATSLALLGCGANVFTTELQGETTVAGSPLPALLNAFPTIGSFTSLDFNADREFKNQGVTKDQVSSVKVESIVLKILSPNEQDFGFLDEVQFLARSNDRETLAAEKRDISDLGLAAPNPSLGLDVTPAELRDHVTAPTMSILLRGRGRQPPQDTRLQATVRLRVEWKVL